MSTFANNNAFITGSFTAVDAVVGAPIGDGTLITGASTAGSIVSLKVPDGMSAWAIMIKGLTTGTIYSEASINSTNGTDGDWVEIKGRKTGTAPGTESVDYAFTISGIYRGNGAGFTYYRLRYLGTYTAGTTGTISFATSPGAVFLNSGIPAGSSTIGNMNLQSTAGVGIGARPDGFLRMQIDPTSLLFDTFETLDITNTWTVGGTVVPTGASGQLVVAPGTVANASSYAKSQTAFIPGSSAYLQYASIIQLEAAVVTGNVRVWGLGAYNVPTLAIPISNGSVFEINTTTGALQGSVYSNSVRTQFVALTRPTDGLYHRYAIYYKASRVYFEIDNVSVGSIALPNPQVSALSVVAVSVNGTGTLATGAVLNSTAMGVGDTARNATKLADGTYPWRTVNVGKNGGLSIKGASVAGQSTPFAAAATGNTTGLDVSEAGNISIIVKNTVAATAFTGAPVLVFEQSDDNTQWSALQVVRGDTNGLSSTHTLPANTANGEFQFNAPMSGGAYVRVRVTTGTTANGMTIVMIPGGLAFTPYSTVVTKPLIVQQLISNLTALNQAQTFTLQGEAALAVQLAGTWTATVTFEGSNDNTNWTTLNAQRAGDNVISQTVVNSTNNDVYRLGVAGFLFVRSRVSAFTSGTVVVTSATTQSANLVVLGAPIPTGSNTIGSVQTVPGTTGGLSTFHLVSAATTNATNIKASAGQVFGWYIYNSNSVARKLNFHNTAGAPTAGAAVFMSLVIPPTAGANVVGETGISFSTGIAITTTTGLTDADATAVALNDLNINIYYK